MSTTMTSDDSASNEIEVKRSSEIVDEFSNFSDRQKKSSFFPELLTENPNNQPKSNSNSTSEISKQYSTSNLRADAVDFSPIGNQSSAIEQILLEASKQSSDVLNSVQQSSTKTCRIYDLNEYKYDYLITNLKSSSDGSNFEMGNPYGLCSLSDNRLLVSMFDRDYVILTDLDGTVYNVYKQLPTPKDVQIISTNPSRAVVALQKGIAILDIETGQILARSTEKSFYPWKLQYLEKHSVIIASDPSSEEVVYFDSNLSKLGTISFKGLLSPGPNKVYPYAAYASGNNEVASIVHFTNSCHLVIHDQNTRKIIRNQPLKSTKKCFSLLADDPENCIITDQENHCIFVVKPDSTEVDYRWPSVKAPFGITTLKNGEICLSCHGTSTNTRGIAVLSKTKLK